MKFSLRKKFSSAPYQHGEIQRLHRLTYSGLRVVMAILSVAFPVVCLVAAIWVQMQPSISAFYYTAIRDLFVGVVFAVGVCLIVYRGYNELENNCLTIAGVLLFGVALAPTAGPTNGEVGDFQKYSPLIHNVCAFGFFAFIAIVCIFARNHGLKRYETEAKYDPDFRATYNVIAGGMLVVLVVGISSFAANMIFSFELGDLVFWLEAAALWVFAAYWEFKGRELRSVGR